MEKLVIRGNPGLRLGGEARMSGAKNAVLPAIAASLLTSEEVRLTNVPRVKDVETMMTLVDDLGGSHLAEGDAVSLRVPRIRSDEASYDLVRAMRASVLVLGPLVARFGKAVVALPGGCAIGSRPVNLHIAGLQKLGARIALEHGYIRAEADRLRGAEIEFEKKTVTGTENLLMAAALAKGETVLRNCAREPEVADLAELLNKMGARIDWPDPETARIRGVRELGGAAHAIIPDRIETGTFLVAGALTAGDFAVRGVVPEHVESVVARLRASGASVEPEGADALRVAGAAEVRPQDIATSPYPGFPTDMQAQMMVLLTQAAGTSIITETIFDRRFSHVNELVRLGASIEVQGDRAVIKGRTPLSGAEVVATDLRASAALVLAGLVASGETVVTEIEHLDRGYERIEEKLGGLGASIERIRS
ncbi:MAG TPA: UDP-N-acetylglucosamine 1-carboxyvinyltransferase [Candidatus Aminicenantes bacterium]|nr:UDP-N-acetylglucosamine 1-carboxyvinyltransferase [Candidatus Aminicenantes bacterium]HRY64033.1 UDP-N-acetylglucosamine 1-carboxyvinyltransferase [Candidatus Aminicenantes bacterium]HRZ70946.1 UDP-N-acetylglucosamine 1-carboxyvinyltransferase [Candidatus Aminicenantes bacterium]